MFKTVKNISISIFVLFAIVSCGGGSSSTSFSSGSDSGTTGFGSSSSSSSTTTVPSGSETVFLSWTPPTENTDNSPLTDLTGYKIYYGISSDALTATYTVADKNASSATVPSLASNTLYYFAVKVVNSKNVESDFSNIISKMTAG